MRTRISDQLDEALIAFKAALELRDARRNQEPQQHSPNEPSSSAADVDDNARPHEQPTDRRRTYRHHRREVSGNSRDEPGVSQNPRKFSRRRPRERHERGYSTATGTRTASAKSPRPGESRSASPLGGSPPRCASCLFSLSAIPCSQL